MDDINESLLAAEGAADAEQSGRAARHKNCLNCGAELKGRFCHQCGQKDLAQRQTLGELLSNFVSSFSEYEGKFLLTARYLITRPGFLALDYNAGRRERYFHPVRMYAFISFIFFLIFFSLPEKEDTVEMTDEDRQELAREKVEETRKQLAAAGLDSIGNKLDSATRKPKKKNRFNYGITKGDYNSIASYDSAQALLPEAERDNWFERKMTQRSIEINNKYRDDPSAFGNDFWKGTKENFSKMLFLLLPVFALLLKLLYVRRNYFYSEHLVFSIYYYNFFYFAGSIMMLVGLIPGMEWLGTLISWTIYFYLLIAMKRMYGQGWGRTIVKFFIFSFLFMLCSALGFVVNLFVIVMLI
ncbi:MAG: DUF3667 domain-containing protein [Cyclobacteriaceae bacterium]|nr:DUF3667 domain-containing protein [Cyclobacteriaceae bacterium]